MKNFLSLSIDAKQSSSQNSTSIILKSHHYKSNRSVFLKKALKIEFNQDEEKSYFEPQAACTIHLEVCRSACHVWSRGLGVTSQDSVAGASDQLSFACSCSSAPLPQPIKRLHCWNDREKVKRRDGSIGHCL